MFTGIIESVGKVIASEKKGGDLRLTIATEKLDMSDVQLGDSIAVNGVCLTAVELDQSSFVADVSNETIDHTATGKLQQGSDVNLEKALTPTTRLGGHLVSGHVDGVGEVVERSDDGRSVHFTIKAPDELAKYIAHKGSITVDGISLTVNKVSGAEFELNIVPHTMQETVIKHYQVGTQVNLEVDLIARYLERLLLGDKAAEKESDGVSMSFLAENGFIKNI
ncbi:MAG: riboflavin synthase [Gammaproteobacteria bacterium]|nr:riboflavin synthase [Gammaproteobacteria bacterium]